MRTDANRRRALAERLKNAEAELRVMCGIAPPGFTKTLVWQITRARELERAELWADLAVTMYDIGHLQAVVASYQVFENANRAQRGRGKAGRAGGAAAKQGKNDRALKIQAAYRLLRKDGCSDRKAVDRIMKDAALVGTLERRTVREGYTNAIRAEFD